MIWVIQSNKVQVPKPAPAALARSECTNVRAPDSAHPIQYALKPPGNGALEIGRTGCVQDLAQRFAIVPPGKGC
jgi:hypothetical protein